MTPTDKPRRPIFIRIGIALIALSGVLWFSLFAIPFLPLTVAQKSGLGAAVFVGVQIAWWTGAAMTGPEVVRKIKGWFVRFRKPEN